MIMNRPTALQISRLPPLKTLCFFRYFGFRWCPPDCKQSGGFVRNVQFSLRLKIVEDEGKRFICSAVGRFTMITFLFFVMTAIADDKINFEKAEMTLAGHAIHAQ